ncbi:MAG TPA: hypothetical protein VF158_12705 [Longimicrobiales bacterium]
MNGDRRTEARTDDALGRALRAAAPEPPLDAVDWERLHGRVMAGVRRLAARAPSRRRWWEFAAAWAARGIPLTATAAAAAALLLAFAGSPPGRSMAPPAPPAAAPATLEDALAAAAGPLLAGATAEDALASALLYRWEEDR